jgi:hypothetical protein
MMHIALPINVDVCLFPVTSHIPIVDWCDVGQVKIDILPDDALLRVFDFYVASAPEVETWHTLTHVCRRWRILVFASPRRLNLRIACTNKTPVREKLDIWPDLPIVISGECHPTTGIDNIKAALKLNDRVCQIRLTLMRELDEIFAALEEPFPALTDLTLCTIANAVWGVDSPPNPVISLVGSTHLRSLSLTGTSIPELPKLLLSSTNLFDLRIDNIPRLAFFPPDAMVTALSAVTRLKVLHFRFECHSRTYERSDPDWESRLWKNQPLPLPSRAILPSLTVLKFEGSNIYLEDLVARIDAPQLDDLHIFLTSFVCAFPIVLDSPQLLRFINRIPKLQAPDKARVAIDTTDRSFQIDFWRPGQISSIVRLEVGSMKPEWHFQCLAQICRSPLFPLPTLECLYIDGGHYPGQQTRRKAEIARWLKLFKPFTLVKNLFLSMVYAPRIASVLQGLVRKRAMEVLPTLENVFIEGYQPSGSVHEAIGQFAAERRLSGRPIVVSRWDRTGSGAGYR